MADLPRNELGIGSRPALVLVDFSVGFTSPDCPLGGNFDAEVEAAQAVLAGCRQAGLPVCYTTVSYSSPEQARVFRARIPALEVLQQDSRWVGIDARLKPADNEPVFVKQWASAFFGTDLDAWLREQGVDSLVVVGLTTSGCVRATVVDGLQYDYPVVVVREAVGDRNVSAHQANLHDMHAKYAEVMPIARVMELLAGLAANCGGD
jgi:nicotinamidase-related amidase